MIVPPGRIRTTWETGPPIWENTLPGDAALCYANLGLPSVPLNGKRPYIRNWQSRASKDPARLGDLFAKWPAANVGVVLPGGWYVVIDVDPRNGGDATWDALIRKHGPLPATVTTSTGGGGIHYWLILGTCPPITTHSLGPGVDIKTSGVVVMPPSVGTVQRYSYLPGRAFSEVGIPSAPQWIRELITAPRIASEDANGTTARGPVRLMTGRIPERTRNVTLTSLAGRYRAAGWSGPEMEPQLQRINARQCDPPLEAADVAGIAASVGRYQPGPLATLYTLRAALLTAPMPAGLWWTGDTLIAEAIDRRSPRIRLSMDTLADRAGVSVSKVQRDLHDLEERGWLTRTPRPETHVATLWDLPDRAPGKNARYGTRKGLNQVGVLGSPQAAAGTSESERETQPGRQNSPKSAERILRVLAACEPLTVAELGTLDGRGPRAVQADLRTLRATGAPVVKDGTRYRLATEADPLVLVAALRADPADVAAQDADANEEQTA